MLNHHLEEKNIKCVNLIYKFTTSVCDGRFGGWGKGHGGEAGGDPFHSLDQST
jgi:hypothetical protein